MTLPLWCCTYIKRGREFCITLPATDPVQLVEDNKHLLRDLRVEGKLVAEYDVSDEEVAAIARGIRGAAR